MKSIPSEVSSLFLSMTFGVRDRITKQMESDYQRTGLAHLLVVSGFQITLLYYSTVQIVTCLCVFIGRFLSSLPLHVFARLAGVLVASGYYYLVGADNSTNRAEIALLFLTFAQLSERGRAMLHSICVSLLCMLLLYPGCMLEPGVQLTYAALIGIQYGRSISSYSMRMEYFFICVFASLFTSVVSAWWFGYVSLSGFVLNIVLAPLFSLVTCYLGFPALIARGVGIDEAGVLLTCTLKLTEFLNKFVAVVSSFSFTVIELEKKEEVALGILALAGALFLLHRSYLRYVKYYNLRVK